MLSEHRLFLPSQDVKQVSCIPFDGLPAHTSMQAWYCFSRHCSDWKLTKYRAPKWLPPPPAESQMLSSTCPRCAPSGAASRHCGKVFCGRRDCTRYRPEWLKPVRLMRNVGHAARALTTSADLAGSFCRSPPAKSKARQESRALPNTEQLAAIRSRPGPGREATESGY